MGKKAKQKASIRREPADAMAVALAPPERWAGHLAEPERRPAEEGGVKVQHVASGLRQLVASGRVTPEMEEAARRFRTAWEWGVHGASDARLNGPICRSPGISRDGWIVARVGAVGDYRDAVRAVGMQGEMLLVAFVCEGLSVLRVAERLAEARMSAEVLADGTGRAVEIREAALAGSRPEPDADPFAAARKAEAERREASQRAAIRRQAEAAVGAVPGAAEVLARLDAAEWREALARQAPERQAAIRAEVRRRAMSARRRVAGDLVAALERLAEHYREQGRRRAAARRARGEAGEVVT